MESEVFGGGSLHPDTALFLRDVFGGGGTACRQDSVKIMPKK
jgi:hypothetical protein